MLKIYGSMLCPDCVECCEAFTENGIDFTFLDFAEDLRNLKAFLSLRDTKTCFEQARAEGFIGIPCIVEEDGSVQLDWEHYVGQAKA